jgi:hypothetical protein
MRDNAWIQISKTFSITDFLGLTLVTIHVAEERCDIRR